MLRLRSLALFSALIIACGPAAPSAAPPAAGKPAPANTTQPVTLTFWHGMNGSEPGTQGGSLRYLVDQYRQVAPNVTINLDFTPYTANELQQKVAAAIAANTTPDLVQGFEADVAAWYQAGVVVALDDFIKQTLSQQDLDDVQKALLDSGRFPQYDNKQLSFPFNRSIYVVYYNKPELTKVGYPEGPKTWDDMQAACDRIVQDNMACYAVQPGPDSMIPLVWSRGGDLLSPDFKKAVFNGPEGVEALTFDVVNVRNKKAYLTKGFDWQNDFGSQTLAMSPATTIAGDPFIAKAVNNAFEIGMAPVPTAPGRREPRKDLFSGTNLAVLKSTPDKERAAWDFIKWLTEPKQSAYWTVQTNYLPVRKSAVSDPLVKDYLARTPRFQVALDLIPSGHPAPSVPGWVEGHQALQDAVTAAVSGTADPKQALDEAARKTDEALARE